MAARGLKCPVVMEFQWDRRHGAGYRSEWWRYWLQLGFDQNGETTVSLTSRHIRSPGDVGPIQYSQRSGWHGSWKTLAAQDSRGTRHAISAKFHYSGNEARAYEHFIDKLSDKQFIMSLTYLVFNGLKTKLTYEKHLTDGEPTRFPLDSVLHPVEREEALLSTKHYIYWYEPVFSRGHFFLEIDADAVKRLMVTRLWPKGS